MQILINDEKIDFTLENEKTMGEILASLDAWLEKSDLVMTSVAVDGSALSPDTFDAVRSLPFGETTEFRLEVERLSRLRLKSLESCALFLRLLSEAFLEGKPDKLDEARGLYPKLVDELAGFLNPEEISFLEYFSKALHPSAFPFEERMKNETLQRIESVSLLISERITEIIAPKEELLRSARLFDTEKEGLKDISVRFQTGNDGDAMKSVLLFSELFLKVIRTLPYLKNGEKDPGERIFEGGDARQFYEGINGILRELNEAFERKDTVLIGDLTEYELVPRMEKFFAGLVRALGV
jgi:hypothetical protein